jgi:hypothetical protein
MSENNLFSVKENGAVVLTDQGIIELAYQDKLYSFFEWENKTSRQKYLETALQLDNLPFDEGTFSDIESREWFTPQEYKKINLDDYILARCNGKEQRERAQTELNLVHEIGAVSIFQHLIYLVDAWRSKNLVWGVGRGSSVSCFILYIIGINKINPLDYNLDYREFFKI